MLGTAETPTPYPYHFEFRYSAFMSNTDVGILMPITRWTGSGVNAPMYIHFEHDFISLKLEFGGGCRLSE
jgi:hypothetical protein